MAAPILTEYMAFWKKQAQGDGWTAVEFGKDRIVVANIARPGDARPCVCACESFAREGSDLDVLKRLKAGKHLRGRCIALLRHGEYQLLQVEAPPDGQPDDMPQEELRQAMRWRVKEMVDFPIEQAGIDILRIPPQHNRVRQMWVVAAGHNALRPPTLAFQDARVPLEVIDIPETAQRNLATLLAEPGRGVALVAFDHREKGGGRLTISFEGDLYMTRHIDVGGPDLVHAAAEALHERVLLDIQRSLDNFDRNYSVISLPRLLVGPLPGGAAFVDYLGRNLSLPVSSVDLADVFDIAQVPGLAETDRQADAWLSLGAALREP